MTIAYVPMTALPPTSGHRDLIRFASNVADRVVVIFSTQPGEPYQDTRKSALESILPANATLIHLHDSPEDPNSEGFQVWWSAMVWGMGAALGGFSSDDIVVTSERYGKWMAEGAGCRWMPYDIDREINPVRARWFRSGYRVTPDHWQQILPEFRESIQLRVTIFGAESTGKTTLAKQLCHGAHPTGPHTVKRAALSVGAHFVPEYARPYLEETTNEITVKSMTAIYRGQRALQLQQLVDYPVIVYDTDLYSTWGYWEEFSNTVGPPRIAELPPAELAADRGRLQSDLYLIMPSNIPFEPDPLRYGGDHREISDRTWIQIANRYELPFSIVDCDPDERLLVAKGRIYDALNKKFDTLNYERPFQ